MNPEFERQLWLELDPGRVLVLVIVLAAWFTVMGMLDGRGFPGIAVPTAAIVTFIGLTVAWGGHRAGESVLTEIRERTWDTQRISALSPWRMSWGKLLGATSYGWIGGGVCLGVFLITANDLAAVTRALIALQAIGGAVLVHSLSLIGALVQAGHTTRQKGPIGAKFAALVVSLAYAKIAASLGFAGSIDWYGYRIDALTFSTALVVITAGWAVFGVYRMMCHELQVATRPWAWSAFLAYATTVATGHVVGLRAVRPGLAVGLVCCLAATYLCAFMLVRDPLALRRVARYLRSGLWRRALEASPLWLVSLALATLLAIGCAGLGSTPSAPPAFGHPLGLVAIPLLLYTVRDLLLLLSVSYGAQAERAEINLLIYLTLLYGLAPAILHLIGFDLGRTLLRPSPWERPVQAAIILLAQCAIVAALASQRYRARIVPIAHAAADPNR